MVRGAVAGCCGCTLWEGNSYARNLVVARSSSNIWAKAATRSACCCRLGRWLLRERRSSAYAIACAVGSFRVGRWRVRARRRMSYTAFHPNGLATSPCGTPLSAGRRMSAAPSACSLLRPSMPWRSCACWEMGRRTVVEPSRSSWMRNWAHSLGTPSRVHAICRAGLLMLSKARRMSQEETRQAVLVSLACSRASTRRSEALSVPWLARNPCWEGSRSWWVSHALRMRCVSMLVHSLRKISSRQMGRRSSMLVSSSVLGSGTSHRCFQYSGMCCVGHSAQSMS